MILKRLFPAKFWQTRPALSALCVLLTVLWFDLSWALETTFRCFSTPELWINTLLLSLLVSAPALVAHAPKIQASVTTLLALWMECNIIYLKGYFTAIPASSYLLIGNLADFTSSVTDLVHFWPDLGFAIIVALAWWVALSRRLPRPVPASFTPWLAYVGILSLCSAATIIPHGSYRQAWHDRATYHWYSSRVPMFTVPGWLIFDMIDSTAPLSQADRATVEHWMADHQRLAGTAPVIPDSIRPKSFVLVFVESLESWPIGLVVEGKPVTPNLNALVADTSRVFFAPNMISQVGAGRSIDAQLLINAGLYPMANKTWAIDYVGHRIPSLTQALNEGGTKTLLLTPDRPETWNQQAVVAKFGYSRAFYGRSWGPGEKFGYPRKVLSDKALMRQIGPRLDSIAPAGTPFEAHIITMSTHTPWEIPDSLRSLNLTGRYVHPIRNYLQAVRYTDEAIAILLNYLYSRPDASGIMTVIVGDHEGLMTYRRDAHASHPYVADYEATPLIIINGPLKGRDDSFLGQVDLYPTLLDMLGLQNAGRWQGMGFSLMRPGHPRAAVNLKGQIFGQPDSMMLQHLRQAPRVSELILRHDMLAPTQ